MHIDQNAFAAKPGQRDPITRLIRLFDPVTLTFLHPFDDSGVHTARGCIGGERAFAFCTDMRVMGGALGASGCRYIAETIDMAAKEGSPVIGLWHSGGARLAEGVESLDGVGRIFAAMTCASGRIPQISVVVGPAAGGAAYGPALTDLVIMSSAGRVFVTGPDVVRAVTGEQIDMEGLGGPDAHSRKSGVTHVVTPSEEEALAKARHLTILLTRQATFGSRAMDGERDLRALLPGSARRAYDVRPLVREILDPADGWRDIRGAAASVGGQYRDRIRATERAHRRRHRKQPTAQGRLPRFAQRRESSALRPHVRFVRGSFARNCGRARLPARGCPGMERGGPTRGQAAARIRRIGSAEDNTDHPQGLRGSVHSNEFQIAGGHRCIRVAGGGDRGDGRGGGGRDPAQKEACRDRRAGSRGA